MIINIAFLPHFLKEAKRFSKKYKTFKVALADLSASLLENPRQGTDLGSGLYKIRLANKSKQKGKSGGFRVITLLVEEDLENMNIWLVDIYDKSEKEDIPKKVLQEYVKDILL